MADQPDDHPENIDEAAAKLQKMMLGMAQMAAFSKTVVDAYVDQGFTRAEAIDFAKAIVVASMNRSQPGG